MISLTRLGEARYHHDSVKPHYYTGRIRSVLKRVFFCFVMGDTNATFHPELTGSGKDILGRSAFGVFKVSPGVLRVHYRFMD